MLNIDIRHLVKQNIQLCECIKCSLRFYDPHIVGDQEFYKSLKKTNMYYPDEKEEFYYAKKYIHNSDSILEIGCGRGAFAKLLDKHNKYIGLDFSENAKKIAETNGIVVENISIEKYAQKHNEQFDVVIGFQVLEHVNNPKEFIQSAVNSLKIGGKLIISVPNDDAFLKVVTNLILNISPHHVTRWNNKSLEFLAKQYNLEVIDIYCGKIENVHKQLYLSTLINNSLVSYKVLDLSLFKAVINKFSNLIARFLVKGFTDEMLPDGHSITAIFKKNTP